MKKAIVLALAAVVALGTCAMADTASVQLYAGQNLIAPPIVPIVTSGGSVVDPDPYSVFVDNQGNGLPIDMNLTRWDAVGQGFVTLFPWSAADYGNVLLGDGAWMNVDSDVVWQYSGAPDGLNTDGTTATMTDMWISLPKAGVTMFGHPFNHEVDFNNCKITDGTQTLSVADAAAAGWFDGSVQYWDGMGQGMNSISVFMPWLPSNMTPGSGYYITTTKDNLALIVPAS